MVGWIGLVLLYTNVLKGKLFIFNENGENMKTQTPPPPHKVLCDFVLSCVPIH